jgi:hypothetical protein
MGLLVLVALGFPNELSLSSRLVFFAEGLSCVFSLAVVMNYVGRRANINRWDSLGLIFAVLPVFSLLACFASGATLGYSLTVFLGVGSISYVAFRAASIVGESVYKVLHALCGGKNAHYNAANTLLCAEPPVSSTKYIDTLNA